MALFIFVGKCRSLSEEKLCAEQPDALSAPLPRSLRLCLTPNIGHQEDMPAVENKWGLCFLTLSLQCCLLLLSFSRAFHEFGTHSWCWMLIEQAIVSIQAHFVSRVNHLQDGLVQDHHCRDAKRTR